MADVSAPARRDWDAVVVGLGAIGSAAAYWLSRSLDPFSASNGSHSTTPNGASADHGRIIRLSYHRPDYVRLSKRAYTTWTEVEAEAGERIVTTTGGLGLWPANAAIPESTTATASVSAQMGNARRFSLKDL